MEKLKVGDTVRLKEGLVVGKTYDHLELLESMVFTTPKQVLSVRTFSYLIGMYYYPFSIIERVESC